MSRLTRRPARDAVLRLIAVFKLAKGLLLLTLGFATINLRHKDITDALGAWVDQLHLDPGGRLVRAVLLHAADLKARRLVAISAGMFVYAALLFTEGTGLLFRKRWAEYFTVIVTASFVPLELYEIGRHTTATRIVVLGINVAVVGLDHTASTRQRNCVMTDLSCSLLYAALGFWQRSIRRKPARSAR